MRSSDGRFLGRWRALVEYAGVVARRRSCGRAARRPGRCGGGLLGFGLARLGLFLGVGLRILRRAVRVRADRPFAALGIAHEFTRWEARPLGGEFAVVADLAELQRTILADLRGARVHDLDRAVSLVDSVFHGLFPLLECREGHYPTRFPWLAQSVSAKGTQCALLFG